MEEKQNGSAKKKSAQKIVTVVLVAVIVLLALSLAILATPLKEMVLAKKTSPQVTLELLSGPVLDEDRGKYLFEVEAKVTGYPEPEVTFNRYDNPEEVGESKITLLLNSGETFSLVAVAENSEGKASGKLELVAEGAETPDNSDPPPAAGNRPPVISSIDVPDELLRTGKAYTVTAQVSDPDGDTLTYQWSVTGGTVANFNVNPISWTTPASSGDPQLSLIVRDGKGGEALLTKQVPVGYIRLSPVASQSGFIIKDDAVKKGDDIRIGDSSNNRIMRGFIFFDIGILDEITVKSAVLRLAEPEINGNPSFMNGTIGTTGLRVNVAMWGNRGDQSLALTDFNIAGNTLAGYTNYDITHNSVAGESALNIVKLLQDAIDNEYKRFLFRLMFSKEDTDSDNQADNVEYDTNSISLYVTF